MKKEEPSRPEHTYTYGNRGETGFRTGKKYTRGLLLLLALLLLAVLTGLSIYLYPGFVRAPWSEGNLLVIGNRAIGEDLVLVAEREVYLHVDPLKEYIDPHFHWDEAEQTAVITTAERVIHMHSEELTAEVNREPLELEFPLKEKETGLYLPMLFLAEYYNLKIEHHPETGTMVIDPLEEEAYRAEVTSSKARLRTGPGIREATLEVLERGDTIRVEGETEPRWNLVRNREGIVGYLHQNDFAVTGPYYPQEHEGGRNERHPGESSAGPELPDHPITLVWEFAFHSPDVGSIGDLGPVQVVSPTWFHVQDKEGNIRNLADPEYVTWAHERGYQVWGLVTNNFDREITAEILTSTSRRREVINRLLALARLYNLDGLNIDFENFHYRYRDLFTQFIRELAPRCRQEGLVLSVDVTVISDSTYYGRSYDRKALAEVVDYMALMAYDEHWAGSPRAGSVSSLPWVKKHLEKVLEEVPAEKLLLGVPFYTRLWEVEQPGGEVTNTVALSMGEIERRLAERDIEPQWDEKSGQYVAGFQEGGKTYQVWLEEEKSMRSRLELVNEHRLAGVAAWRRGFEKPEIWEVIEEVLESYPRN